MIIDPLTIKALCIFIGPLWGLMLMWLGFKVFDSVTPFDTAKQLSEGNSAVGTVVGSIFIGVGLCVGLIVGIALF